MNFTTGRAGLNVKYLAIARFLLNLIFLVLLSLSFGRLRFASVALKPCMIILQMQGSLFIWFAKLRNCLYQYYDHLILFHNSVNCAEGFHGAESIIIGYFSVVL